MPEWLARHHFLHELVTSTLIGASVYAVCALTILTAEWRQHRDLSVYRSRNALNDLAYVVFYQCSIYNLLVSPFFEARGYRVRTIGDDIAWLRVGDDGRLWAVNPETGCFGVSSDTGIVATSPYTAADDANATFLTPIARAYSSTCSVPP